MCSSQLLHWPINIAWNMHKAAEYKQYKRKNDFEAIFSKDSLICLTAPLTPQKSSPRLMSALVLCQLLCAGIDLVKMANKRSSKKMQCYSMYVKCAPYLSKAVSKGTFSISCGIKIRALKTVAITKPWLKNPLAKHWLGDIQTNQLRPANNPGKDLQI